MGTVRNARVNQGGPKCAGIVGLGLIGGSFARGYAQAGVRVLAWDPDDDVMTAASMGTVAGELNDETLGECDIIVLACYPEACIEWLEAHTQALADATDTEAIMGPVVIDTVGVKGIVCERAFELAREHGFYFVGAHPMAGTQYSGYAHSRADLFQGAPLVLVPPAVDDALKLELLGQVREMVRPLGFGKFSVTSAAEHDRGIQRLRQEPHRPGPPRLFGWQLPRSHPRGAPQSSDVVRAYDRRRRCARLRDRPSYRIARRLQPRP